MKNKKVATYICITIFAFAALGSSSTNDSSTKGTTSKATSVTTSSSNSTDNTSAKVIDTGFTSTKEEIKTELENSIDNLISDIVSSPSNDLPDGITKSQENAIKAGKNYLNFTAFSKQGLIGQLSSEYGDKYPVEDATYAVEFLETSGYVDWNEQAAKSAKNYLSFTAFSRQGLIDQLTSEYGEQFTKEQAEYGVTYLENNALVDWNEQAAKSAKNYLSFMTFSRQELIDQLTSEYGEKFTKEQAEYGVTQAGY